MVKEMKARVQQKIDTSANWAKATNFIPLKGEIIIYSDTNQIKTGDGITKINDLKFTDENKQDKITTSGILQSDGAGNITAADEIQVELVDITPESIGAQPKITANGFLVGYGDGIVQAGRPYFPIGITETRTPDDTTQTYIYTYSADKTYQEIRTALTQGYIPVAFLGNLWFYLSLEASYSSNYCFLAHQQSGGNYISDKLECSNDNTWTRSFRTCISREGPFSDNNSFTLPEIIQNLQTSVQDVAPYTKLCSASVPTANWQGSDPYTQSISCGYDVTGSTIANIQLSDTLYDQLVADGVTYLNIENTNGALFIKAKGGKPSVDLTLQITCTETRN